MYHKTDPASKNSGKLNLEISKRYFTLGFDFIFHWFLLVSSQSQWSLVWSCQCAPIDLIKSFFTLH